MKVGRRWMMGWPENARRSRISTSTKMTPDMIASEIKKRWEGITTELVRRKRLDPKVYDEVVSTLAQIDVTEDHHGESNG